MPRPAVADFVDSFFIKTLFQDDEALAVKTLEEELAPDAAININGNTLDAQIFKTVITAQFRPTHAASIVEIKDLNIVPHGPTEGTGTVAQFTRYETVGKADGAVLKQSATTIVQVGERDGKRVITAIWEAQTIDQ
ncbi:hypothetical protein I316_04124 [Kwoniella heveanensis BCC8398]|uniref:SnoaL-like domain-containing protein n=1 Tax=Kwoniella heveanensis BCC8398 TaxID=1296120 RepID=A0A1B9GSX2_9TREE|nr:hypothetical protein I316_04124 [Kwoniella heveanensis BCC8398]